MKPKATLIIKNLEKIYTMTKLQGATLVVTHGFIAIHHDYIMKCGCGDFSDLMDADTRLIDGTNHIAIPGFLEVHADVSRQQDIRLQHEYFMRYRRQGTMCMVDVSDTVQPSLLQTYEYEVLHNLTQKVDYPIVYVPSFLREHSRLSPQPFCISCHDEQIALQNQLLAAQLLAMKEGVAALRLLEALTVHPAHNLNLPQQGVLEAGKRADILVVSTKDIHDLFYSFDQQRIAHIIHKGVRIYPNLLI